MKAIDIAREVILKEQEALSQVMGLLGDSFNKAVDILLNTKGKVIVCGVGKAGIIGHKLSASFSSLGTPSFFLHPSEAAHGDLGSVQKNDAVILISNSGNSQEVLDIIPTLKQIGCSLIAITGNNESKMAKACEAVLTVGKLEEACGLNLAPTTSTTAILALGDALVVAVMRLRKGFDEASFGFHHPAGNLGKKLVSISAVMNKNPVTVLENMSVLDVLMKITSSKTGCAVLVDATGVLMGIFTDGDLRRVIQKKQDLSSPIGMVATLKPMAMEQSKKLMEAIELMGSKKIKDLPIVDEVGRLVGILTTTEILALGL